MEEHGPDNPRCKPDQDPDEPGSDEAELDETSNPELAVVSGLEELIAANEHIRRSQFGVPQNSKYEVPFSRQLRRSIREDFPVDGELYAEADVRERQTLIIYFIMRIVTVTLFGITLFLIALTYRAWFAGEWIFTANPTALGNFGPALALIGSVTMVSYVLRRIVRFFFFYFMRDRARSLSFKFAKRYSDILSRVTDNCYYGRRRLGEGDWTVRGRNHMKMALWNAKRAEYLDRYVTTIVWLIRVWVLFIEAFFFTIMGLGAAGVIIWVWMDKPDSSMLAAQFILSLVLLAPLMIYLWVFAGRKSGNFWTEEFRGQIAEQSAEEEHYFDRIGKYVEDLIDESRSKEFGGTGKNQSAEEIAVPGPARTNEETSEERKIIRLPFTPLR